MIKIKLTKIVSNHQNLRTDEVIGVTPSLPEVAKGFVVFAESLSNSVPGNLDRTIVTSPIVSITKYDEDTFVVNTANSTYNIQVL